MKTEHLGILIGSGAGKRAGTSVSSYTKTLATRNSSRKRRERVMSNERIARNVLARFLEAKEFSTREELQEYLSQHPGSDKSKHSVSKKELSKETTESLRTLKNDSHEAKLVSMRMYVLVANADFKDPDDPDRALKKRTDVVLDKVKNQIEDSKKKAQEYVAKVDKLQKGIEDPALQKKIKALSGKLKAFLKSDQKVPMPEEDQGTYATKEVFSCLNKYRDTASYLANHLDAFGTLIFNRMK